MRATCSESQRRAAIAIVIVVVHGAGERGPHEAAASRPLIFRFLNRGINASEYIVVTKGHRRCRPPPVSSTYSYPPSAAGIRACDIDAYNVCRGSGSDGDGARCDEERSTASSPSDGRSGL